ncbi:DEKNAAC104906 [Brettanomyces naardenensis]|uniref:DEKNAAC104906 n=1 Tax=Brettanomyces naardenensis TaxID=13370 RepID=A0A448YS84_BRENA|nr:DEKNAAC104906 [Brettanomyces naardenensis]
MSSPSIAPRVSDVSITPSSSGASKLVTKIVTSKTWVLPPRPKPGRKPSSDVPATKRKAQNRAAQRAFRERRANRVTELEDQLMELERANSVKQGVLSNTIKTLQNENASLQDMVSSMKTKISDLSKKVLILTEEKESLDSLRDQKRRKIGTIDERSASPSSQPLTPPQSETSDASKRMAKSNSSELAEAASVMINFKNSNSRVNLTNSDRCSLCTREECLCDDIGLKKDQSSDSLSDLLNNFKPMVAVPLKLAKAGEIDFTSKFATNKTRKMPIFTKDISKIPPPAVKLSISSSNEVDYEDSVISSDERCGFCSEDTPCVCREIAKQKSEENSKESSADRSLFQSTAEDCQLMNKQVAMCTGNPGTCPQCQKDPMSTLFCTTLAATSKVRSSYRGAPILRHSSSSSTSQSSILPAPHALLESKKYENGQLPSLAELEISHPGKHYVPCADAYRTLSRHANFGRAGFNNIISNLNTNGMFVEVESIVKCLRQLDRQFGSN